MESRWSLSWRKLHAIHDRYRDSDQNNSAIQSEAASEDVQRRICFVGGSGKGLRELNEGKAIGREKVKEGFSEWL